MPAKAGSVHGWIRWLAALALCLGLGLFVPGCAVHHQAGSEVEMGTPGPPPSGTPHSRDSTLPAAAPGPAGAPGMPGSLPRAVLAAPATPAAPPMAGMPHNPKAVTSVTGRITAVESGAVLVQSLKGVDLRFRLTDSTVIAPPGTVLAAGQWVTISIRHTGKGMDAARITIVPKPAGSAGMPASSPPAALEPPALPSAPPMPGMTQDPSTITSVTGRIVEVRQDAVLVQSPKGVVLQFHLTGSTAIVPAGTALAAGQQVTIAIHHTGAGMDATRITVTR